MAERGLIDFADLAQALLQRVDTLVPAWLPGGQARGHEYVCADLGGGEGGSLSVNLKSGVWADFSGDDRGGDLISLYAAIHNLNQGQAARALMAEMGWQGPARNAPAQPPPDTRPAPADAGPPAPAEADAATPKRRTMWRAITPVPVQAPAADFKHWHYTALAGCWEYRWAGQLLGYVARFSTSDGGKEILPRTWCVDDGDERGTQRWHWKQWDEPRPLYVPAGQLDATRPVVLVEGEKCALAGHELLGSEFDFVSWPGGSKAWQKCDWRWLAGRTVVLWPDADAKRVALTREQREQGVDPASMPLQAQAQQPGMRAMQGIGALLLLLDAPCTVRLCPLPTPDNTLQDGWDIADAIALGWDAALVRAFIDGAKPWAPAAALATDGKSAPSMARAGTARGEGDGSRRAWRARLLVSAKGAPLAVRDNLVLALDGIPSDGLPGIDAVRGVIAFNEFTNDVLKLRAPPWGGRAGVWEEEDELEMGNWLTREHYLPSMPRGTLEEAVVMVSKRHRFHPVRDRLERLRGTWDGAPRLHTWLQVACLKPGQLVNADTQAYLARVGTWMLMAMCARVLPERKVSGRTVCGPGTKFDYMPIFEGLQGVRKSTLAAVLGWEYSADTGLVLGDKDSYQNLQGIWVYEWGELDSLTKSDVTKVKQFVSSQKDRFRASFDRRPKDYPRQVVFIGTTNEAHYLTDPTGNRRFWPIHVTREIDIKWVTDNLEQMFAEALSYVDAGERFHPTSDEQRRLFDPQQMQRTVDNAIDAEIVRVLYDENQAVLHGQQNMSLVSEVELTDVLRRVGYTVDKQTTVVMRQAGSAMRRLGWEARRSSGPGRPRVYCRPKELPELLRAQASGSDGLSRPMQGETAGADSDCPF